MKKKKKGQKRLEWAAANFLNLSHDTASCIMTQGMGGAAWACTRRRDKAKRVRSDTPRHGALCAMTRRPARGVLIGLGTVRAQRARCLGPLGVHPMHST